MRIGMRDGRVRANTAGAFIIVTSASLSPDGRRCFRKRGSYGAYQDAVTGECEQTLEGHWDDVTSAY